MLKTFRLESGLTLLEIERELNLRLACFGFVPVTEGSLLHPYEQMVSKLFTSGQNEFRREDIERLCSQEGLWIGRSMPEPDAVRVGIRSFIRWAEHLEDQTDAFLDLVPHFVGRHIKSPQDWQTRLWPEIEAFVGNTFRPFLPVSLVPAGAPDDRPCSGLSARRPIRYRRRSSADLRWRHRHLATQSGDSIWPLSRVAV